MRTIKFRAWIENKKYMAVQGTPDLETLHSFMFHYGNSENLMQFTGLFDKNGKEIYEGDVVKFHYFFQEFKDYGASEAEKEIISVIEERELGIYLRCKNEEEGGYLLFFNPHEESFEIIGNIHENHELLK